MIIALRTAAAAALCLPLLCGAALAQEKTQKPPLHGSHWMAITGKPLAATAGAMMFQKGGNAVDAACAMLAATCTMWDTLSAGAARRRRSSTTRTRSKVIGINALGVAPTGATPEFYQVEGHEVSAGVRTARRGHARHAGRPHDDARRVRHALAEGRARARRSRWRTATRSRRAARATRIERANEGRRARKQWPYVDKRVDRCVARAATAHARRRSRARSSGSPISPRRCASSSRPKQQALKAGKNRKEAIYGRVRPLLQRRHRAGDSCAARRSRAG